MTRRRLTLAAVALVVVAPLIAWWLSLDRLTSQEHRLVGTWFTNSRPGDGTYPYWAFRPDRTVTIIGWPGMDTLECHWSVRDDVILVDAEQRAVFRALRPHLEWLGFHIGPVWPWNMRAQTADQTTFIGPDESLIVWDRILADGDT